MGRRGFFFALEGMKLFENEITIEARPMLEKYLGAFEYKTSGLTFTSLYMWRNIYQYQWQICGDYLCIAGVNQRDGKETPFLYPPLTCTGCYEPEGLRESVLEARQIFEAAGCTFNMMILPLHMVECMKAAFSNEMVYYEDRANYDYVYRTSDLIELAGRDYHAKKNHLNYFLNHYDYEYGPLTSQDAEAAKQFIREFNVRKGILPSDEKTLLEQEEKAMWDVFTHIEAVGYLAGAIRMNGKIEAISIGGYLGRRTVTVHVEKANTDFRGLYQAINNEFCKHVASHVKLINREEDMGLPGLRKAKLSYKPVKLIENHIAVFKSDVESGKTISLFL